MGMDDQVILTSFVNEMDAQVLISELQSEGIDAVIRKDDCGGIRPWITAERGVEVLVMDRDLVRASEIAFGQAAEVPPLKASPGRGTGSGCLAFAVTLCIGLGAGFAGAHLINYLQTGRSDLVVSRDYTDRNNDGRPDLVFQYDKDQLLIGGRSDENFDGEWDYWWDDNGLFMTSDSRDADFNGTADIFTTYSCGIIKTSKVMPNGSPAAVRQYFYEHGVLVKELVDTDKDGTLDLELRYDPFGEVISEREL